MASAMPPPANTALWVSNQPSERELQLVDDRRRLQLEDWRTINPGRGPVRGFGRGGL